MGENPGFRLIQARFVPAGHSVISSRLGKFGAGRVLEVERLFLADDTPIALGVAYYPEQIGQRLLREDLNHVWMYKLLEEELGIVIDRAYEEIGVSVTNARQAKLLGLQPGDPVLTIDRVTYAPGEIPVECGMGVCRADRFRYRLWRRRR